MNKPLSAAAFAASRLGFIALFGASVLVAQTAPKPEEKKDTSEPEKLEKFEVTGSRIKRVEAEGPSPIHVISHSEIEASGRSNLTELLRDMPETSGIGINEGSTLGQARGVTALDLRSLGPNNTLVIVNGRRVAPNGINSGGTVFVDLGRFPLALIERVEVLKDGASAIYGSDATAGVVNIILRKDFTGAEVSASYGNTFKQDAAEQNYSVIGGAASGKARAMVGFSYTARNALSAQDRSFSRQSDLTTRFLAKDAAKYQPLVNAALTDLRSATGVYATVGVPTASQLAANGLTTAAILNPLTGATATFLPGTGGVAVGRFGSSASFASVPFGAANSGRPTVADFTARSFPAGPLSNNFDTNPYTWLVPATARKGIEASFDYDLGKNLTFYSEFSYQRNESETQYAPTPISTAGDNNIIVPATNYYNPFGIPVAFTYRPVEMGPRFSNVLSNSYGYLGALRGSAGRFDFDFGYSYSFNESTDTGGNQMSESRLRAALAKTTPDALNIFGGTTFKNNQATLDGIRVKPQSAGNADTATFDGRVTTDRLFEIPMGSVGAAFYAEDRHERFNVANDALSNTLDDVIGQVRTADPTKAKRGVQSVALETRIPIVKEGSIRFLHTVELSAAARYEKFTDGYNSGVKPFVGLRFRPIKDLLIRASYGDNFRAPTLTQLYAGPTQSLPNNLPDLRRPQLLTGDPFDGAAIQRLVKAGGNPTLQPEVAHTKQIGLVFDVPGEKLKGLSLDFTYGVITQNNIVTTVGTTFIRNNEIGGGTGDLVTRDSTSESYRNNTANPINVLSGPDGATTPVQPGQTVTVPGRIQFINDSYVNLATQIVKYADYGIRYNKRTVNYGRFVLSSNWSYFEYYASRRFKTDPLSNVVGRTVLPRYRGQTTLGWQRKEWSGNVSWLYTHRYGDLTRNTYEADRYYTFSANMAYQVPAGTTFGLLDNTRLSVGIDNIFDTNPPLARLGIGYEQGFIARPQGRFVFVGLRKTY